MKKLSIGADHTAVDLKSDVMKHLASRGIEVVDEGAYNTEKSDYPSFASKVAKRIQSGDVDHGILICGTGLGMSIAANKYKGIRAAAVSDLYSAEMSKTHNNANILCFGARVVTPELATQLVDAWLDAEYEGERHQKRLDMIADFENEERL